MQVVLDRETAIRGALSDGAPEDVIVVAGKGHETVQHVGGATRTFSDRDVMLGLAP